jgi:hypothetical protein
LFHHGQLFVNFLPHCAQCRPNNGCHLQHRRRAHDGCLLVRVGCVNRLAQAGNGGLRDRKAASRGNNNHPLARIFKGEHLAIGGDVI